MKPVNTRIWTWNRLRVFETRCGGRCALVLAHRCHRLSVSVLTDEVMWGFHTYLLSLQNTEVYTSRPGYYGRKNRRARTVVCGGRPGPHSHRLITGTLQGLKELHRPYSGASWCSFSALVSCARSLAAVAGLSACLSATLPCRKLVDEMYICMHLAVRAELSGRPRSAMSDSTAANGAAGRASIAVQQLVCG